MGWKRNAFEWFVRAGALLGKHADTFPDEPRSILVLRNNDLGDVLVITPLFEALRKRFPRTRIVAGVGDWAAPILEGNPNIDAIQPINAPWHNAQVRPQGLPAALRYISHSPEAAQLHAARHDVGIDVLGSGFGSLLLVRAGIPFRLGVRGYAGGHTATQRWIDFDPREHVGRAAMRFAELLGAVDLPENRPQLFLKAYPSPTGALVFAPGGGYAEKCWPHFAELAGLSRNIPIIVIGGERDRPLGASIANARGHVTDLTGKLGLRESFAVIAAARAVVCNSSIALHAAAAFRKPTLLTLGAALPDAAQHAAQWAYPETRVLALPSPEAAREELLSML